MPSDITDLEDAVYSALLLGRPTQALADAGRLDIWLATHIADFLDALDLIEREPDEYVTRYCTLIAACLRSDVLVLERERERATRKRRREKSRTREEAIIWDLEIYFDRQI